MKNEKLKSKWLYMKLCIQYTHFNTHTYIEAYLTSSILMAFWNIETLY